MIKEISTYFFIIYITPITTMPPDLHINVLTDFLPVGGINICPWYYYQKQCSFAQQFGLLFPTQKFDIL